MVDKKKPAVTQQPNIVRTLKQGPVHLVYVGQKHIGNIVQPIIGGSKKRVKSFLAMSKETKKRSNHDSKKDALTWLSAKTGYSKKMSEEIEMIAENPYANMQSHEIKQRFETLYQSHVKNGMAPKIFKSPLHLAKIEEKNHKLPSGTLSSHVVKESDEQGIEGSTPHSRMQRADKRATMNIIKKDPKNALKNIPKDTTKVAEAFMRVYNAAIQNEELFDKDKNKKDKNAGPKPEENSETGDVEVEIKKTQTGEKPGDIISINPKLKTKGSGQKTFQKPEHKKAPNN